METIKVNFVDFWVNHLKDDNYFYNLLSTKYRVVIDEVDPDLIFYSVDYDKKNEKQKYLGTRSKLVYYTGESQLPNWDECDLAFTFDFNEVHSKNYRLPLWMMYLNWFDRPYNPNRDHAYYHDINDFLEKKIDKEEHIKRKELFCNFTYSNPTQKRSEIFPKFSLFSDRDVVSAGRLYNNVGWNIPGRSDNIEKMEFLDKFKFTISCENRDYLGYTTEKLIHPMFCHSVPIYWGNDRVGEDFNPKSFINMKDFQSDLELVQYVNDLDKDDEALFDILSEPWFTNGVPDFVKPNNVMRAIESIL